MMRHDSDVGGASDDHDRSFTLKDTVKGHTASPLRTYGLNRRAISSDMHAEIIEGEPHAGRTNLR